MKFATFFAVFASLGTCENNRVATVFNRDTYHYSADPGAPCVSQDQEQMVCMDEDASLFGRTLFDMDEGGIPRKRWQDPAAFSEDYFYTTDAKDSSNTLRDPFMVSTSGSQDLVQVVPDVNDLAATWAKTPTGNCVVNMFIGDYPFPAGHGGGKYQVKNSTETSPTGCQNLCIGTVDCALWTYLYNSLFVDDDDTNCFLQSQDALNSLNYNVSNDKCGFDPTTISAFPNCQYNPSTKLCAIYTGYAVTGRVTCEPKHTPTASWMQYHSICSAYSPSTTSTPRTIRTRHNRSGTSTNILLMSITPIIIIVLSFLL